MERKLYRDEQHKVIGGVCAGLAAYLNIDVSIVRVLFLLAFILKGSGGLIYIIMWIVLPKRPFAVLDPGVDYIVQPEGTAGYVNPAAQKPSGGRQVGGIVLIAVGVLLLLNEFDFIPDFDYEYFWPTVLIVVGLIFIFTSRHKNPVNNSPFDNPSSKL